jgi:hypothetical protein
MDARWPLVVMLVLAGLFALSVVGAVLWLIAVSTLPTSIKVVLGLVIGGFFGPGAKASVRRVRTGANPWSKSKPERG